MSLTEDAIKSRILAKLTLHVGRHKAVGMGELFEYAFLKAWNNRINDTRRLRKYITEMRWDGIPICSTSESTRGGYYLGNSATEIKEFVRVYATQPALKKLALAAKILNLPLKEVMGQLTLDLGPEAHE